MRRLVTRLLSEAGFRVSAARDGREMWEVIGTAPPDAVLLDVMLPGTSGLDLLRRLRERSCVPVLMLTARGEEMDRVLGLELGADDYVAKPFAPRELVARVRALLRRAGTPAGDGDLASRSRRLAFAGWVLDTARRELTAPDGAAVDLSGAEYDLLLAFLEHPQRVLTREQLLEVAKRRVGVDPFDRTVDVQVSRLRRKIEPDEGSPAIIKTVRGAGYLFVPDVGRA
ncbi:response regulator [Muricoccus radiodurans]|uniref:response regulator n=1 Tax=Muricoccus radiodurans TaxID=2231721 RepID=UPI003CF48F54